MGAVPLEQSHVPPQVPEGHQLLAQNRDAQRHIAEIVGEAHRLPEAPEVLAARRTGPTWVSSTSSWGDSRW